MDRPSTRPAVRPGGGAAGDFLQNRPQTRPGQRPPGQRPPGQRPPGVGDRPTQLPGTGRPPGQRPPAARPPAARPPGTRPPGTRPPGVRPPGHRPGHRPPGARPPGYRPPGHRPPGYRPPGYRPPRPGHLPHYGGRFWGRHPHYRWGWHNHPHNWWRWATAGAVTGWFVGGIGGEPAYYDYGTNLYYEGDNVVYNDEVLCTTEEYAEQAQSIATAVPEVDPDQVEWMPLGIFALTQKDGSVEDSTLFIQLAISKEGIIAGTFQNTATSKSTEVEGTVDTESQRAAWAPVGESWPIMETGIYNLTENESDALLHFEDGQTQQWTMVRLDEPEGNDESQ